LSENEIVLKFKAKLEKSTLSLIMGITKKYSDGTTCTESTELTHIPIVEDGTYRIELKMVKE